MEALLPQTCTSNRYQMACSNKTVIVRLALTALAIATLSSCSYSSRSSSTETVLSPAAMARADGGIPPYTRADVEFMTGMIGHHAQAVVMARLAPTQAESNAIRILAERISVSQQDEIDFMSTWLRDRKEKVPIANTNAAPEHFHHGADHAMMPGMLTPAQMDSLSKAKGAGFDRLFLTFMIQHHQGALDMLDKLFSTPGAGQDNEVFRFASDVGADQNAEIERMQMMLDQMAKANSAR